MSELLQCQTKLNDLSDKVIIDDLLGVENKSKRSLVLRSVG